MKRCFVLLLLLWPLLLAAQPPLLRVGYFYLPPHGYTEGGKPAGYALQYFERLAGLMGVQASYRQEPLSRLLQDRQLDMVLYLGRTAERRQLLQFASQPLFLMQGVLVVRQQSPYREIRVAGQLQEMRIGIWADGYLSPLLAGRRAQLDAMSGDDVLARSLQKLALGRIDAFYSPEPYSVREVLRQRGWQEQFRLLPLPEPPVGLYAAFTRRGSSYLPRYEQAQAAVAREQSYVDYLQQRGGFPG